MFEPGGDGFGGELHLPSVISRQLRREGVFLGGGFRIAPGHEVAQRLVCQLGQAGKFPLVDLAGPDPAAYRLFRNAEISRHGRLGQAGLLIDRGLDAAAHFGIVKHCLIVEHPFGRCNKASLDLQVKRCFSIAMDAIADAISKVEGGQAALARHLGVTPQAVNQWVTKTRPVPARLVLAIESLTGVSRHVLRPDVFGDAPAPSDRVA